MSDLRDALATLPRDQREVLVLRHIAGLSPVEIAERTDCEGPLFRTTGSLAGVQGGNVNVQSLSSTTTFAIGEGEQALDTELSENGGASWSGPEHSSAVGVAENTAAEATEIKTTL